MKRIHQFTLVTVVTTSALLNPSGTAGAATDSDYEKLLHSIYKELIETNTTYSRGDTVLAARKMAKRLLDAGYPPADVQVLENAPRKGNLVARLRSPEPVAGPILLLAHIDVVEANPEDWEIDPFTLNEDDEYFYGRGTVDDKDEAAIHIANLIRWKQEGYVPNRDIIVALTADEEGGPDNGVQFLLANHRDLVDADLVINEGGGGAILDGKYVSNAVQTAEKVYQSYTLEITDSGGHSSRPKPFNPIYDLAAALTNIGQYQFPIELNETTRASIAATAQTQAPELAALSMGILAEPPEPASISYFESIPGHNATIRTTCVATMLEAGHAQNALPQRATATVNCRILPGNEPEDVRQTLIGLVNNEKISVTPVQPATPSDPSPLTDEIMTPIREITESMWPGVVVVPAMSTGATDGLFFRNAGIPVYGVSGIFGDAKDSRAHGRDERLLKRSLYEGAAFLDQLTRRLTSPVDAAKAGTRL